MRASAAVILSIWAAVLDSVVSQFMVQEVNVGSTAVLPCPSNDDNHRFQFWQLQGDQVLGPGNAVNRAKYKYEVLSGTLYIKVRYSVLMLLINRNAIQLISTGLYVMHYIRF
jgi:hypothetical protein